MHYKNILSKNSNTLWKWHSQTTFKFSLDELIGFYNKLVNVYIGWIPSHTIDTMLDKYVFSKFLKISLKLRFHVIYFSCYCYFSKNANSLVNWCRYELLYLQNFKDKSLHVSYTFLSDFFQQWIVLVVLS